VFGFDLDKLGLTLFCFKSPGGECVVLWTEVCHSFFAMWTARQQTRLGSQTPMQMWFIFVFLFNFHAVMVPGKQAGLGVLTG